MSIVNKLKQSVAIIANHIINTGKAQATPQGQEPSALPTLVSKANPGTIRPKSKLSGLDIMHVRKQSRSFATNRMGRSKYTPRHD